MNKIDSSFCDKNDPIFDLFFYFTGYEAKKILFNKKFNKNKTQKELFFITPKHHQGYSHFCLIYFYYAFSGLPLRLQKRCLGYYCRNCIGRLAGYFGCWGTDGGRDGANFVSTWLHLRWAEDWNTSPPPQKCGLCPIISPWPLSPPPTGWLIDLFTPTFIAPVLALR